MRRLCSPLVWPLQLVLSPRYSEKLLHQSGLELVHFGEVVLEQEWGWERWVAEIDTAAPVVENLVEGVGEVCMVAAGCIAGNKDKHCRIGLGSLDRAVDNTLVHTVVVAVHMHPGVAENCPGNCSESHIRAARAAADCLVDLAVLDLVAAV